VPGFSIITGRWAGVPALGRRRLASRADQAPASVYELPPDQHPPLGWSGAVVRPLHFGGYPAISSAVPG